MFVKFPAPKVITGMIDSQPIIMDETTVNILAQLEKNETLSLAILIINTLFLMLLYIQYMKNPIPSNEKTTDN